MQWQIGFGNGNDEGLVASIVTARSHHYLAVALRKDSGFTLCFGLLERKLNPFQIQSALAAQPTSISMHIGCERTLIVVANAQGAIEIFAATQNEVSDELHKIIQWRFSNSFEICDSLAVLNLDESKERFEGLLIICGLRNGQLQTLKFQRSQSICL